MEPIIVILLGGLLLGLIVGSIVGSIYANSNQEMMGIYSVFGGIGGLILSLIILFYKLL